MRVRWQETPSSSWREGIVIDRHAITVNGKYLWSLLVQESGGKLWQVEHYNATVVREDVPEGEK